MNHLKYRIQKLTTIKELEMMQRVEAQVWKMDPIPIHQTFTALQNGGIILGAFENKKLIGFLYSFPGFIKGNTHLCSHMLGILPEYRTVGLGEKMKLKQAKLAREAGYSLITWTFDPLESRNAYLNLHKLSAIGAIYSVDHYGLMTDELNQGLPSDRIVIKWNINASKRTYVVNFSKDKLLLDVNTNEEPVLTDAFANIESSISQIFFVAIPMDFQAIKRQNFNLAKTWRIKTRPVFKYLFNKGFQATDVLLDERRSLSYYVFTRETEVLKCQYRFNK